MKKIQSILKPLINQIAWGVQWDSQLNMDMSFGNPLLRIREPYKTQSKSRRIRESATRRAVTVKGKWWLWVFCADWNLKVDSKYKASNKSNYNQKLMAMSRLDGQRIVSVKVNKKTGETVFSFDLGAKLEVRRFDISNSDIWTLYCPTGMVLSVMGNGTYSYQKGNTPPNRLKLVPLEFA